MKNHDGYFSRKETSMNNLVIPHINLSKSEILEISELLSISNRVLKVYHKKMAVRKGRIGYRDKEGNSFTKIDLVNLIYKKSRHGWDKETQLEVKGVLIDPVDVKRICDIKEKEYSILSNYSQMFYKLSKRQFIESSSYEMDDLQSECITAALKAIYIYDKNKSGKPVSLFTFLYLSVKRHLSKLNNNMLSALGDKAVKIKQRFIEFQIENPNLTFDDIVEELEFSPKEVEILNCSLNLNVLRESDRKNSTSDSNIKLENIVAEETVEKLEMESVSLDIVKNVVCGLSDLEKQVLKGYLNAEKTSKKYNCGIGTYAKKLINPKTKKPYSKMAISYAWKRVQEKIKKAA